MQEALSAIRLDHPGLVKLYDSGYEPDRSLLYIVMDFIPGDTLGKTLDDLSARNQWDRPA